VVSFRGLRKEVCVYERSLLCSGKSSHYGAGGGPLERRPFSSGRTRVDSQSLSILCCQFSIPVCDRTESFRPAIGKLPASCFFLAGRPLWTTKTKKFDLDLVQVLPWVVADSYVCIVAVQSSWLGMPQFPALYFAYTSVKQQGPGSAFDLV
jgi:hypothetical protein